MVYSGQPSRACRMCRVRRIKCDEAKPACNRCTTSRRRCPGYRDEFDLKLRDETKATEARTRKTGNIALAGQRRPSFSTPSNNGSIIPAPGMPLQELASCHFISNYILIPQQGTTWGFLDFVIPLMKTEPVPAHLQFAFNSCALASLNNRVGTKNDFYNQALGSYTKALAAVSTALGDSRMAKQDATLASVILLGVFDSIMADHLSKLAWSSHVEGAIQLLRLRGRKQLRTKNGLMLFIAVRNQMVVHSLSTGIAPVMGFAWWTTDTDLNEYTSEGQRLIICTAELTAEINRLIDSTDRAEESTRLMLDKIRKCQSLDQEFAKWTESLPSHYAWKTVAWEDRVSCCDYTKVEVFPGRVDIYKDLWWAGMWNVIRCARIMLSSATVRSVAWTYSPVDYRTRPEYMSATRICCEAIADIIASVPYHLGGFSRHNYRLERANLTAFACGEDGTQKSIQGYFLIWPLACILGQDYLTDSQRLFINARLDYIRTHLGVKCGNMLTKVE